MKNKLNNPLLTNILLIILIACFVFTTIIFTNNYKDNIKSKDKTVYSYEIYRSRIELTMEGVKDDIVTEIDKYIDSVARDSGLNGIRLFELCEKYCVDVRFAMAQAEVESHFGTKGLAAKTNIVWNVKAYDGITAEDMTRKGHVCSHPDHSIEPYLLLLTNDYLVDGKTEEDMFINFVNFDNKRYASNVDYENMILNVYNKINSNTNISNLLKEYNKYKMILL